MVSIKFKQIKANISKDDYMRASIFTCYAIQELLRKKYGKKKNILQLLGTAVKKKLLTDGEAIFIHQYEMRVIKKSKSIKTNAKADAKRLTTIMCKTMGLKKQKNK